MSTLHAENRTSIPDPSPATIERCVRSLGSGPSYVIVQGRDGSFVYMLLAKFNDAIRDVMSPHCHVQKGVAVQSLHCWDRQNTQWKEILVEDRNATPAELAASRIDFPAWLATLSRRNRRIALRLADGDAAGAVAQRFGISPGRISQLRRELAETWQAFHGEFCPDAVAAVPT